MAQRFPQKFGPYTLHEMVGRGGMAEIFRASMPGSLGGFERTVAIKRILPHLTENEEFITMLIDEANIIVSIDHHNIAQVYDLGKIDDSYYIAMEYIHGVDLATVIKAMNKRNTSVPPDHAAYIGSCICAGLHAAHGKRDADGRPLNIVHRDVSPHNILISFAGDVKIIDFGVAKANLKETHTQHGVIKGKLLYMAPEQATAKDIDGRSDLFAAGLVMYKMLTNSLPFEGDNEFQIYNNILTKEITPPRILNPNVPPQLDAVVMKLLARDLNARYQDGYSAKQDLERVLHTIAPGYTVNRLSRYIDENFGAVAPPPSQDQSHPGMAPNTPTGAQNTGEHDKTELQVSPFTFQDDDEDTVNQPADRIRELVAAAPPPLPQNNQFRVSVADDQTGQFEVPNPPLQPSKSKGSAGIPLVAIAVVIMVLVVAALIVMAFFVDSDGEEPTDTPVVIANSPAPPEVHSVEIRSEPSGARVFQEDELVGITPIHLELEASEDPVMFRLAKSGYEEHQFGIAPTRSLTQEYILTSLEDSEDDDEEQRLQEEEEERLAMEAAEEEARAAEEAAQREADEQRRAEERRQAEERRRREQQEQRDQRPPRDPPPPPPPVDDDDDDDDDGIIDPFAM